MALKTRVQRVHMALCLNWYEEQLSLRYSSIMMSEAQRETLRRDFAVLQQNMRVKEKTNCWQVALEIVFKDNGTYQVGIIDESTLLYLD